MCCPSVMKAKDGDKVHYWTEAGTYKLSASFYSIFYFDYNKGTPVKGGYQTLTTKPIELKVGK